MYLSFFWISFAGSGWTDCYSHIPCCLSDQGKEDLCDINNGPICSRGSPAAILHLPSNPATISHMWNINSGNSCMNTLLFVVFTANEDCVWWGSCIRPGRGFQKAFAQAPLSSACPGHLCFHCWSVWQAGSRAQNQGQEPVTKVRNQICTKKLIKLMLRPQQLSTKDEPDKP